MLFLTWSDRDRYHLRLLPIALLLFVIAGCSSPLTPTRQVSNTATAPSLSPFKQVIRPPCGEPLPSGLIHYVGASLPTNVHQTIGFYPLLPQQLPQPFSFQAFDLWTYKGEKPLLHAQYGIWMAGADGSADLFDVLMIDEVAAPLTPLQYLASDTPLHITKQTATHVGQINATLSLLESASQATQLHQLLWKADGITLRVTAVTKGTGSLIYHDTKEQIQFKHEISDEMLMNLARSIAPDAHCG